MKFLVFPIEVIKGKKIHLIYLMLEMP